MNKLTIIGNLTKAPELKSTPSGVSCCTFDVAVNRRVKSGEAAQTDYFRVTAWRQLGDNCARYLAKGRKVCVVGSVTSHAYITVDGSARSSMEVNAEDVEFLSPRDETGETAYRKQERDAIEHEDRMTPVETDELPF